MSKQPVETTEIHTRLLKCALEVDDSRSYWRQATPGHVADAQEAFDNYWFGAKSLARVQVLLRNFRLRFDAYPDAFRVLHEWQHMDPETRQIICHWHLQLADPLYRQFTGDYLVERREGFRDDVTRDLVVGWVAEQGPGRWTMTTRIQFASKLLSCASGAGLLDEKHRGPRKILIPRVTDSALTYGVYLLRGVEIEGTLLDNPYFRSVGLDGSFLEDRLKGLEALRFRRQGDLLDFGWQYPTLTAWASDGDGQAAGGGW